MEDLSAPAGYRRALVNHYMSAESPLKWSGGIPENMRDDYRDIVMVAGTLMVGPRRVQHSEWKRPTTVSLGRGGPDTARAPTRHRTPARRAPAGGSYGPAA